MKNLLPVFVLLLLAAVVPARAAEYALVPKNLSQIINPNFRNSLSGHAPDYDSLSREDQILAFVQVYRSLNYGESPILGPSVTGVPVRPVVPAAVPYATPYATAAVPYAPYGSAALYRQTRAGDVYGYVDGFGYRRANAMPVVPRDLPVAPSIVARAAPVVPSTPTSAVPPLSNPSAPPAVNPPQAAPGTGAPPYARPLVPRPRHVPDVHAGP